MMNRNMQEDIKRELADPEYAKYFGASDTKAEIAITLVKAREKAGKTQKELAEIIGLSQPYISKLEGGEANPSIGTIGSILAILGFRLVTTTTSLLTEIIPDISFSAVDVINDIGQEHLRYQTHQKIRYPNAVDNTNTGIDTHKHEIAERSLVGGAV
jgi:transcriptional regulator with XRE-family HTH domain